MGAQEYVITSQPIIFFRDPHSGETTEGREVNFRDTQTGQHGRVLVPNSNYNPEHVRTLILAELKKIRAVHALQN